MGYICGGCGTLQRHSSAERFDPAAGVWEALPSMVAGRSSPAAAVVAGRIYICCGRDSVRFLSSAERFDPTSGEWETLRPMSARRGVAAAAVLDGRLYVCGGHDGLEFRRSVERFDPDSGTWELLPPMRSRRSSASAVALWSCSVGPTTLGTEVPFPVGIGTLVAATSEEHAGPEQGSPLAPTPPSL